MKENTESQKTLPGGQDKPSDKAPDTKLVENSHPDQKYVTALLNNNAVLLDELYSRFSGKIKTMVLQNNGTETDAADIFQDALLSIYHKAVTNNFILTCPLEAFLYLICKNKWMNQLSRRKLQKVKFIDTGNYENIGQDSFKESEQEKLLLQRNELLKEKLSELSESTQKLLHLSWSGKSMEEVANILNVTYGYARKKKSEAMAKLIELVKKSPRFKDLKVL
jgi:RNA polymerase sigma factor (sigma-70 family)